MKKLLFPIITSTIVASLGTFSGSANAAVFNLAPANFLSANNAGTVDTTAQANGLLNTTSGSSPIITPPVINPNGFGTVNGGFFTTPFVSLGALGTQTIRNSVGNQNNEAYSTIALNLTAIEAANPVQVLFDFAFAGNSQVTPDNFRILFVDAGLNLVGPLLNFSGGPSFFTSQAGASLNVAANTFTPGVDYFLGLILNENSDGTSNNTAAGFNNIVITTNVPFEFSPALGVLGLAGLFGANQFRKKIAKRKQAVDVNSIG